DVYQKWKCNLKGCHNGDFFCFVDDADGEHYILNSTDTARWAKAIKGGNATLDIPTGNLRTKLLKHPANSTPSKKITNISNHSTPLQSSVQNHFNINIPDFLVGNRSPFNIGSSPPASESRRKSS